MTSEQFNWVAQQRQIEETLRSLADEIERMRMNVTTGIKDFIDAQCDHRDINGKLAWRKSYHVHEEYFCHYCYKQIPRDLLSEIDD